ncbi:hypothetical protein PGT21_026337 [Puccinia graminis f. sp. tritici]|uniref:Uncharacterized protein n=1 Tax=Puccinia graminis f. sp. tritici TaxID=56615 RepID=A0A5B0LXA6_PUCGR|nr:hypothetical protein PGT21_026337 [Puccinia graminis f. sp. tritici]
MAPSGQGGSDKVLMTPAQRWPLVLGGITPLAPGRHDRPCPSTVTRVTPVRFQATTPTLCASPSFGGSLREGRLRQPGTGPPIEGLVVKLVPGHNAA